MLGRPGCGRSDCLLWAGQLRSRQRRAAFPARRRGVAHKVSCVEEVDRALVDLLRRDGRMSYTDLGKAVGLSTSAVHQRVRRLGERGVIRGYSAQVAHEALGMPLTAFVAITPFDQSAPDDIPDRLRGIGEIEACYSVAGEANYLLPLACPPTRRSCCPRPGSSVSASDRGIRTAGEQEQVGGT